MLYAKWGKWGFGEKKCNSDFNKIINSGRRNSGSELQLQPTCSLAFVNKALIRRGMRTKGISSKGRRNYCGFILGLSYLALASLAVAMVFTSSTAELKSLMFSEEYRPAGLLYWLVTTLEPKGRALLLWLEPMCFTSCQHRAEKVGLPGFGKAKWDEHRSQEFVKHACRLKHAKPNGANQAKLLLAL